MTFRKSIILKLIYKKKKHNSVSIFIGEHKESESEESESEREREREGWAYLFDGLGDLGADTVAGEESGADSGGGGASPSGYEGFARV